MKKEYVSGTGIVSIDHFLVEVYGAETVESKEIHLYGCARVHALTMVNNIEYVYDANDVPHQIIKSTEIIPVIDGNSFFNSDDSIGLFHTLEDMKGAGNLTDVCEAEFSRLYSEYKIQKGITT